MCGDWRRLSFSSHASFAQRTILSFSPFGPSESIHGQAVRWVFKQKRKKATIVKDLWKRISPSNFYSLTRDTTAAAAAMSLVFASLVATFCARLTKGETEKRGKERYTYMWILYPWIRGGLLGNLSRAIRFFFHRNASVGKCQELDKKEHWDRWGVING